MEESEAELSQNLDSTCSLTNCLGKEMRKELGLSYHSRNLTTGDRALQQSRKIQRRLELDPADPLWHWMHKPKRMHWRTFERELMRSRHREAIYDRMWMGQDRAILGKR
jgi:hypothetical protein